MVKILFCSTGSAGHRLPMLPLAEAFVRRGHDVAWATAPDALPELTGRQFALFPAGLTMSGARQIYRQRWPEAAFLRGEALSAHTFPRLFGGVVAPAMLADLELILDRWQPAFVINEAAALAAPLACKRQGFKHVTHGFGLRLPPPHLASAMQEFGAFWASADGPPPADGRLYEHLYLDIAPPGLSHSLAPTIPRSLLLRPASPRIREIMALPTSLRHMLSGSNRPLIYLSFGTVFNHSEALGMAAAALARLDATAIVTVGRDGDPGSLGGSRPLCMSSPMSIKPGCCPFAMPWSPTPVPARCWVRRRTACPSSCYPRRQINSGTRRPSLPPAPVECCGPSNCRST